MRIFSRLMKSRRDSLVLSVRLTRRTATVTMSAPEAAWARRISSKLRYFPVPTIKRELKARPAITSWSAITILRISLYSARTAQRAIPAGPQCPRAAPRGHTRNPRQPLGLVLRPGLFHVCIQPRDHILITLFDHAPLHFQRISQLAARVSKILIEQRKSLGLFILRQRRRQPFDLVRD